MLREDLDRIVVERAKNLYVMRLTENIDAELRAALDEAVEACAKVLDERAADLKRSHVPGDMLDFANGHEASAAILRYALGEVKT